MKVLEVIVTIIALFLGGIFGAWTSRRIRAGGPIWLMYASGFCTTTIWFLQAKYSRFSLLYASILFDVVYTASWYLGAVYYGEHVTPFQLAAIGLMIVSLIMMNF